MNAGVHPNGVAWTSLNAVTTEDASQFVDDECFWIALVAVARVINIVLSRFDINALRRARCAAAEASYAARRSVIAMREPMHAAETLRIDALLLRIAHRGYLLLALGTKRVLEEPLHCHAKALSDLWHVALLRDGPLGLVNKFCHFYLDPRIKPRP